MSELAGLFVLYLGVALVLLSGAMAIYRSVVDKTRSPARHRPSSDY